VYVDFTFHINYKDIVSTTTQHQQKQQQIIKRNYAILLSFCPNIDVRYVMIEIKFYFFP